MLKTLEKALLLSEKINSFIEQDNWQKAEELQLERDSILNVLPQAHLPTEKNELLEINRLTLEIKKMAKNQLNQSKQRKDDLLQQIKGNNTSKKMKAAYQNQ